MKTTTKVLALAAMLLLNGCYSTIGFNVQRYDLDICNKDQEKCAEPEARKKYNELHQRGMTLAERKERLKSLQKALDDYHSYLLNLNIINDVLSGKERNASVKMINEGVSSMKEAIIAEQVVNEARMNKTTPAETVMDTAFLHEVYARMHRGFKDKIVMTITEVKVNAKSQKSKSLEEYNKRLDTLKSMQLKLRPSAEGEINGQIEALEQPTDIDSGDSSIAGQLVGISSSDSDLVPRTNAVYQDLSDPFLGYIASHTENWKKLPNSAKATDMWGGDSEFILVFDNRLDGRWKRINVDPTKVINARLKISQKIAGAVTALAGVAVKAYGVPVPHEILKSGSSNGNDDQIDYSLMTAEETLLKKENQLKKGVLKELQVYARTALANNDFTTQPEFLLDQLLRRMSEFGYQGRSK